MHTYDQRKADPQYALAQLEDWSRDTLIKHRLAATAAASAKLFTWCAVLLGGCLLAALIMRWVEIPFRGWSADLVLIEPLAFALFGCFTAVLIRFLLARRRASWRDLTRLRQQTPSSVFLLPILVVVILAVAGSANAVELQFLDKTLNSLEAGPLWAAVFGLVAGFTAEALADRFIELSRTISSPKAK